LYVVQVILMVPVYAVDAFFALKRPQQSFMLGLGRMLYEAFVLYRWAWGAVGA
jgi:hypothetical protein